jgi:glycosyltransferase involved in cell wall biosynthesis
MGRFVEKKGFAGFIAALARLHSGGVAFRAVLAGDGPERATLQRLATQQGLNDRLSFPGWVHDKMAFFAGIDVFCLPSLHEPFGIVLLEALAQAQPIVATDSEGPAEILRDGIEGIVVPRNDADRLAGALWALLDDPVLAARLGSNAYHCALEQYDIACVGARLDAALRRVAQDQVEAMP